MLRNLQYFCFFIVLSSIQCKKPSKVHASQMASIYTPTQLQNLKPSSTSSCDSDMLYIFMTQGVKLENDQITELQNDLKFCEKIKTNSDFSNLDPTSLKTASIALGLANLQTLGMSNNKPSIFTNDFIGFLSLWMRQLTLSEDTIIALNKFLAQNTPASISSSPVLIPLSIASVVTKSGGATVVVTSKDEENEKNADNPTKWNQLPTSEAMLNYDMDGDGKKDSTKTIYQIANATQWLDVGANCNDRIQSTCDAWFILRNDLDFATTQNGQVITASQNIAATAGWIAFMGILDGQNHLIKNLKINIDQNYEGAIFGKASSTAIVRNLTLDNSVAITSSSSRQAVGSVVGMITNSVHDVAFNGWSNVTSQAQFSVPGASNQIIGQIW